MGKTAHLAVDVGRFLEVQVTESVALPATGLHAEMLEQAFPHQMGRVPQLGAQTQIHIGLAEVDGQQLGMAIGHVQQTHIAEARQIVKGCRRLFSGGRLRLQDQSSG